MLQADGTADRQLLRSRRMRLITPGITGSFSASFSSFLCLKHLHTRESSHVGARHWRHLTRSDTVHAYSILRRERVPMRRDDEQKAAKRCKPGDLAIVTKCEVQSLIGLVMRVIEPAVTERHDWITEIQGAGVIAPGAWSRVVMLRRRALMLDECLTPLAAGALHHQEAHSDLAPGGAPKKSLETHSGH